MAITVYKIGGSLLGLPDLLPRLELVLQLRDTRPVLVVGGGKAADLVREWDRMHALDAATAHWLAIRAMGLNERLLEAVLPGAVVVASQAEADAAWDEGRVPIVSAFCGLGGGELEGGSSPRADARRLATGAVDVARLPASWDVTSDSIAAFLTVDWSADELVLIKSREKPTGGLAEAVAAGAVDGYFQTAAAAVQRIAWVNLRDANPRIAGWLPTAQFSDA